MISKSGSAGAAAIAWPTNGAATESQPEPARRPIPLWLCVYFPGLSREVLALPDNQPAAVIEQVKGRPLLQAVSPQAAEQGMAPGMPLSAAYALCPALRIESRQPDRERQALKQLADCALDFTPWVSLDFDQSLLLEIRGSLNLFGGPQALTANLRQRLASLGHRTHCAATPSPYASWLLASHAREQWVDQPQDLRSMLGDLPSAALGLDERTHERLLKAGLSSVRDLWRLPRDGLARRYGTPLLKWLDEAAGTRAAPLRQFESPPRFLARLEMPAETEKLDYFFPAIEQLIERLAGFLLQRDAAVSQLCLSLQHRGLPPTRLRQGSRRPERNAGHFLTLLHERLEHVNLPAPVCAVTLSSEALLPWTTVSTDLFANPGGDPAEWQHLLDQLETRLGPRALRALTIRADHRPERARSGPDHKLPAMPPAATRPLWLLAKPQPTPRSELTSIQPQPERIESGWWDEAAVRRDYHIAIDRHGARLWIYRELRNPTQWYLHGLFG